MVNWEYELKRYLAKKFKAIMGFEIPIESIHTIMMDADFELSEFTIEELANIYAFAIMKEDYEQADNVKKELSQRDCKIVLDVDEKKREATINLYVKPKTEVVYLDIKMKVLPDG